MLRNGTATPAILDIQWAPVRKPLARGDDRRKQGKTLVQESRLLSPRHRCNVPVHARDWLLHGAALSLETKRPPKPTASLAVLWDGRTRISPFVCTFGAPERSLAC